MPNPTNCVLPSSRPQSSKPTDRPPSHRLIGEREFREVLGGISERTFKGMKATGAVPPALQLGPRLHRWTQDDVAAAIAMLPRVTVSSEPLPLATARRQRIDRVKAGVLASPK